MRSSIPRVLLVLAAAVLAFDGLAHAYLYGAKFAALAVASNLPPLIGKEMAGLWIWDAFVLVTLAAIFLTVAVRPTSVSGRVVMLVAFIPISLAAILIRLLGFYFPVFTVGGSGVVAVVAGFMLWRTPTR